MSFRAIIAIVVIAVIGWSGYWWVNASLRRDAVETWFAERQADGWVADYADLRITGFPNRVDTILTDVELADPDSGWMWQGPRFEMLTLSYQPFEIIAVWPGQHQLASPYQRITVEGDLLRASLAVSANGRFELNRSRVEGRDVTFTSTAGWVVEVPELFMATEQPEGVSDATQHRMGLTLTNLMMSSDLKDRFDPADILPERVDSVHVDAVAGFEMPISLSNLERDRPMLDALDIADVSAAWGQLDMRAQGAVQADAAGLAEGNLNVRLRNWEDMLDLAVVNGALDETAARTASFGLGLLAAADGDRASLAAPLTFRDGRTRIGPLSLGPAPRLH
ncbi:hypothetical protein SAMN06273572_101779 [Monaibacterium marinum]|uniref:DUF2125 domain-containing protein n=1 Tax=Pontivivens marinum TaxID=1690039 RepID=A0A2C9CNZ8_9RHOB|nr:DUF2125 domain-containing protein [Monaibacterium marinum]SOH92928.1 hypothetical protein SAMN06273572_101779 [Monaibacterium marinum]